ncbi:hypothetical protein CHS0354_033445 [Potamilus streckersoni]|uniref:Acyl-CoA-binding domain-containing protein 6 n=1 Tax=Potamilus streckersoni TaxID=2493646 RepID=A0AAE0SGT8_9BIVA|nr:hypothetical protein CHS0354_033445 [Potamilus streckersoni]
MADNELKDIFHAATDYVRQNTSKMDSDTLLYLYARYKQVTIGPCNTEKPGFFDFQGKQKWEAWKKIGKLDRKMAMVEYITTVGNIDPDWKDKFDKKESKKMIGGGLGVVVSTLQGSDDDIDDEKKTIFDWCKEGNTQNVRRILETNQNCINVKDDEGMTLLHWACDRGLTEMVKILLERKAYINEQDADEQTALHFAVTCEHPDVVEVLLAYGADISVPDSEGQTVMELETSSAIKRLLQNYTNR